MAGTSGVKPTTEMGGVLRGLIGTSVATAPTPPAPSPAPTQMLTAPTAPDDNMVRFHFYAPPLWKKWVKDLAKKLKKNEADVHRMVYQFYMEHGPAADLVESPLKKGR